ncbi:hypothetical protein FIBSPDRAFT_852621 [Athelia psychrophila]|uniref:HNH nuclease domain-containing protein n=1 Tax=Athelia psychrophila TaxID=1759441 RepID=A0A166RNR8_9AGAM|nr:hypothetical protein FIBSPDRAFT_852621 [Fibularhizoctonia sp. CBS 109695]
MFAPQALKSGYVATGHLVTGYILPYSLNNFEEGLAADVTRAAISWDMLRAWSSYDISKFVGDTLTSPMNGVLLRSDLASDFKDFLFWFEETGTPDSYIVKAREDNYPYHNQAVTFHNEHDKPIDLPNREILALHRSFGRVLHFSGAGEYLERTWHDIEDTDVLSADGSTDVSSLLTIGMQKFRL